MRILLLTHAFNSLTQRLAAELASRGHELSIEFDIADSVTEEAVSLFKPDLIVAPYLRRAIPETVWRKHVCLVVHPGIKGDAGPSALDWTILNGRAEWGVTVLQAEAAMDAGPVWASENFPMRAGKKSSIYRNEVTQTAVSAVLRAVERFAVGSFEPQKPATLKWQPLMKQADRAIDWSVDTTATVLAKINAADGSPGVADSMFSEPCHLFDACAESTMDRLLAGLAGDPGAIVGARETALLRATVDGGVWIGHVKRTDSIKLPATLAFAVETSSLPSLPLPEGWWRADGATWQDISYEEHGAVGFLHFDFYNGAMSTTQCRRLREALVWAKVRPVKVLVLMGGSDFWSNGIHLNVIEQASLSGGSAADESWNNINAMNDLALELIETPDQFTIAALAGNTGAGGCFLARAADRMWVRDGVMLNPHYKNMGNLYGSEYWTYLLPRRVGTETAAAIMRDRQPMTAERSVSSGFSDAMLAGDAQSFRVDLARRAAELARSNDLAELLEQKRTTRAADEAAKPLARYREEELAMMQRNFYGFDPSYHVARHHFVRKSPASWTPRHLARHRDLGWVVPV
jgi:putative two-component system hydrogenase maturation factor HypX/HoxX